MFSISVQYSKTGNGGTIQEENTWEWNCFGSQESKAQKSEGQAQKSSSSSREPRKTRTDPITEAQKSSQHRATLPVTRNGTQHPRHATAKDESPKLSKRIKSALKTRRGTGDRKEVRFDELQMLLMRESEVWGRASAAKAASRARTSRLPGVINHGVEKMNNPAKTSIKRDESVDRDGASRAKILKQDEASMVAPKQDPDSNSEKANEKAFKQVQDSEGVLADAKKPEAEKA